MIIDAHSHVHDPVGLQLAALDAAGIDQAVTFVTRPHPERAATLEQLRDELLAVLATALSGQAGGPEAYGGPLIELEEAAAAAAGRLIPFGPVPLDLPPDSASEWIQARIVSRGWRGIGELTPSPGAFSSVGPVLAAAADHSGLPVVVHGFHPTTAEDLGELASLAARHPSVPVVIGQLGGLEWLDATELAQQTPNLWLDLATPPVAFAPRLVAAALPERVLFATNAPYGDPHTSRDLLERTITDAGLLTAILEHNPQRLLGL